jgi:hypothetical protein
MCCYGSETGTGVGLLGAAIARAAVARVEANSAVQAGERAVFALDTGRLQLFDPKTVEAIRS